MAKGIFYEAVCVSFARINHTKFHKLYDVGMRIYGIQAFSECESIL